MAGKLVFGYWNTRGRAQPIRFLLEYVEADYEDKKYLFNTAEESAVWFQQDKKALSPFPNLPYIQDGDFYLSEHDSVIKYIVRRNPKFQELLGIGKGPHDEFRVDQLVNIINELRELLRDLIFNPKLHEVKKEKLGSMNAKFAQLIEFKGNNTFLLPYLTVADFKLVEILLYYKSIDPEEFETHLKAFDPYIISFYTLPRISEYVKTDEYQFYSEFFPPKKTSFTGGEFLQQFNKQFL